MADPQGERRHRFEALLEARGPDIVSYCRWRSHDAFEAEEAVADVLLVAWRKLDEVPDGDRARLWLYATARRVLANRRRSARRQAALYERLSVEPLGPEVGDDGDPGWLVREALRRLDAVDREVLLLAEWEGLTGEEMAAVLDCRPVTARGRLHRARQRFRAAYEELAAPERRHESSARLTVPKECPQHA